MITTNISKMDRVLNAFKSGEELTEKQITAQFGVANPRATVSNLRMKGYPIHIVERKTTRGYTSKYRLVQVPREVVAAGYQYLAMQRQA